MLKFIAVIENYGDAGYIAWMNNKKGHGQTAQGKTAEDALNELIISLKIKCAYEWGAQIEDLAVEPISLEEFQKTELREGKIEKEISVCFA